jgi:ankyrin repeat protein
LSILAHLPLGVILTAPRCENNLDPLASSPNTASPLPRGAFACKRIRARVFFMKIKKHPTLPIILLLLTTLTTVGCGKKAKDKSSSAAPEAFDHGPKIIELKTLNDFRELVMNNDFEGLKTMLRTQTSVDLGQRFEDGETLMTLAASVGNIYIADLLFEQSSALLFRANSRAQTPLMVAARRGISPMLKVLLGFGAKTDEVDNEGNSALHLAIINGHEDLAITLLNVGADFATENNEQQTPLELAQRMKLDKATQLIQTLSLSNQELPQRSFVVELIMAGKTNTLRQLMKKHLNLVSEYKDLNFFVVIQNLSDTNQALALAQLFLSFNADINGPGNGLVNPLISAVRNNKLTLAEFFIDQNANLTILDQQGKSALIHAIQGIMPTIVKKLLNRNAPKRTIHTLPNGRSRTINACSEARSIRRKLKGEKEKEEMKTIMKDLGCGLGWPF